MGTLRWRGRCVFEVGITFLPLSICSASHHHLFILICNDFVQLGNLILHLVVFRRRMYFSRRFHPLIVQFSLNLPLRAAALLTDQVNLVQHAARVRSCLHTPKLTSAEIGVARTRHRFSRTSLSHHNSGLVPQEQVLKWMR